MLIIIALLHVVLGAAAYATTQYLLYRWWADFPPRPDGPGWFLNDPVNVLIVIGVIAGLSMLIGRSLARSIALSIGATVAMITTLFLTGPGNLFPIVIVVGAALLGGAAVAGYYMAEELRQRRQPMSGRW